MAQRIHCIHINSLIIPRRKFQYSRFAYWHNKISLLVQNMDLLNKCKLQNEHDPTLGHHSQPTKLLPPLAQRSHVIWGPSQGFLKGFRIDKTDTRQSLNENKNNIKSYAYLSQMLLLMHDFSGILPPPPPPSMIDHPMIHWKKYVDSWEQKIIKRWKNVCMWISFHWCWKLPAHLPPCASWKDIWKRKGGMDWGQEHIKSMIYLPQVVPYAGNWLLALHHKGLMWQDYEKKCDIWKHKGDTGWTRNNKTKTKNVKLSHR